MSVLSKKEIEQLWKERPAVIKAFIENRPQYEQLVSEVCYILKSRIASQKIEIASVTGRVKTLNSFAEKIIRKEYDDPISRITDLAGARCVYLYLSDRHSIESIIEREFQIIEKVDKLAEKEENEFGYGALHYLVKLGPKSSGARYDDLKELICEIQVRTVLQDAWSIIDHHLLYKKEKDAPKPFRRKLNSLSGLFETADSQFEQLKQEREKYIIALDQLPKGGTQELNLDTLVAFLKQECPEKSPGAPQALSASLNRLLTHGYKSVNEVAALFKRTAEARAAIRLDSIPPISVGEVARALALIHDDVLETYNSQRVKEFIIKNREKVKAA